MVMAMELYVIDVSEPVSLRFSAALRLLKVWCCFRADDLQGSNPSLVPKHAARELMEATLPKAKTDGPDKKRRVATAFLYIGCGLVSC